MKENLFFGVFIYTKDIKNETDHPLKSDRIARTRDFALSSGNSIPDFVPVENYLAMIRAAVNLKV